MYLLSDYNHPAQALSDIFTVLEIKKRLEGLKMVYVGDGNHVARSLLFACMNVGMHFAIATPPNYTLTEEDYELGENFSTAGASIDVYEDPNRAVADTDIIYTDVWTSMGQEEETAARLKGFPPSQINQQLVNLSKPNCLVMH